MFDYFKDKFKKITGKENIKDNIVNGIGSIGYVQIGQNIKYDLLATMILAEVDNKSPFILDYASNVDITIKKLSKETIDDKNFSLRCYFDDDCTTFIQINVLDNQIDSCITYVLWDKIFWDNEKQLFITHDNHEYTQDLWLNEIMQDDVFIVTDDYDVEFEFEKYLSKSTFSQSLQSKNKTIQNTLTETSFQRGIQSDDVNREVVLISHLDGEEEHSINVYIGIDVSIATLEIK